MATTTELLRYCLIPLASFSALFLVYFYTSPEPVSLKILKATSFSALFLAFLYIVFGRKESE